MSTTEEQELDRALTKYELELTRQYRLGDFSKVSFAREEFKQFLSQHTQRATVEELYSLRKFVGEDEQILSQDGKHTRPSAQGRNAMKKKFRERIDTRLAQLSTKDHLFGMKVETDEKVPNNAVRFDHWDGRSETFTFGDTKDSTNKEEA